MSIFLYNILSLLESKKHSQSFGGFFFPLLQYNLDIKVSLKSFYFTNKFYMELLFFFPNQKFLKTACVVALFLFLKSPLTISFILFQNSFFYYFAFTKMCLSSRSKDTGVLSSIFRVTVRCFLSIAPCVIYGHNRLLIQIFHLRGQS